jgi:hypothetical protein
VLVSDTSPAAGDSVTVDYEIANIGSGAAGNTTAGVYLSTNSIISTADTLLGTQISSISNDPGDVDPESETVTLPSSLAAGTYYIGVIADYDNAEAESDESNNWSSHSANDGAGVAITISAPAQAPDLIARDLTLSSTMWEDGESITADWIIENVGGQDASDTPSYLYASSNSIISTADTLVGFDAGTGTMSAGEINPEGATFTLDLAALGLAPGTYHVGALADPNGEISESNESNNASNVIQISIIDPSIGATDVRHDFNGDGVSDILWRNDANGSVGMFAMDNNGDPTWQSIGSGSLDWTIEGTGDFNADGTDDILWRNDASGSVGMFAMDSNGDPTWDAIGSASLDWSVQGHDDDGILI